MHAFFHALWAKWHTKSYMAISPVGEKTYCAVGIEVVTGQVTVNVFAINQISQLAKKFKPYSLILGVPASQIVTKTWFFPCHVSSLEIYQAIRHELGQDYFDLEMITSADHANEYLVIAHVLPKITIKPYLQWDWPLAAIEPEANIKQRNFTQSWQLKAMHYCQIHYPSAYQAAFKKALILLERDNYYD